MGQIHAPAGATTKKTIVGRGSSSKGRTCGRGNNGQNSRSGGGVRPGFEGGQMPLYRRVARRGFSNYPFKKEYVVINVSLLNEKFDDGATIDREALIAKGFVSKHNKALIKILGTGDVTKKFTVAVDKVSESAKAKIEKAGGEAKVCECFRKEMEEKIEREKKEMNEKKQKGQMIEMQNLQG